MLGEEDFTAPLFSTKDNWLRLSKKYRIRLPLWRIPCTTGGMRRFLKKMDISVDEYLEANNFKNLKVFPALAPEWPLRAWVGLQLEWKEWMEEHGS